MAFEKKPNSFSLFRNHKKETDRHPDYKGSALIDGKEYWVSAWINEIRTGEKAGQKYMNGALELKEQQFGSPTQSEKEDFEEDIPF